MEVNEVVVQHLLTEYLENPLGIDARRPRLSWQLGSLGRSLRGVRQSAYQVQAAAGTAQLVAGDGLLWDSGKVPSDRTQGIPYEGSAVASRERVCWRVRAWDQDDSPSAWSKPAFWEMGLLEESDWTADWIEVDWEEDPQAFKPCPFFRSSFTLQAPTTSARLYITSHGLYEAWLNGQRVGDQLFTPGYTPYDKMLQYQVYDVTGLLHQGENALGAILGDGWYRGKNGTLGQRNTYGTRLALLAQLQVETADGQTLTFGTGPGWQATTGPIITSDLKDGEVYDARLDRPGWNRPGYQATWQSVRVVQHAKHILVASRGVPVRRKETFQPTLIKTPKGETVLDFGQNLAGVVHFQVSGPRGTTIRLRHGEALDKDGNFTVANIAVGKEPDPKKSPFQQVEYTLKGEGVEEYEPRFAVHGFRYVKVEGYPGEINPADFSSVAIYSDMPRTGTFECSDPLISRLHKNVEWSMKSNFLDLPTDCPQRERAGWTGDAQIFAPSAAFLMDTRAFFRKWLEELTLEQRQDGMLGNYVPNPLRLAKGVLTGIMLKMDGSSGWGDAAVLIPWALYQAYGDLGILEQQYESMKAWVNYQQHRAVQVNIATKLTRRYLSDPTYRARQQYIWDTNYHWGEWLEAGDSTGLNVVVGMIHNMMFGAPVVATAYFAHSTRLLAKTADLLGKADDAGQYHALADQIKSAYIAEFIGKDGRIEPDRQASYVRVLAFDLAPEEVKLAIVEHVVRLIRAANNHIGTGFLSTVFICEVLAANGRLDVAYELLTQKTIPSWLYAITKGATTIWESWEGIKPDGAPSLSLNHYSPGAVVNFLHRKVAGIEAAEPGYKRIRIHPQPGGGLTSASSAYESVHGLIASSWMIENGRMRLDVTIPANTGAVVILPGANAGQVLESGGLLASAKGAGNPSQVGNNTQVEIGAGSYRFEYPVE